MTEELAFSAPAERNKDPILEVLMAGFSEASMPVSDVLEIASGYGQHVVHFAAALPALTWHPSDPDLASRQVMTQRVARAGLPNIQLPIDLNVMGTWPSMSVDAIIVANLLHISPPETLSLYAPGPEVSVERVACCISTARSSNAVNTRRPAMQRLICHYDIVTAAGEFVIWRT